jgi:hypothetical protein
MPKGSLAPRPRREAAGGEVLSVLFDFDLLVAAYHWDRFVIWQVTGHSPDQLRAMREHKMDIPPELALLLERLWALHYQLWLNYSQPCDYRAWWNSTWGFFSPIGERTPLVALAADGIAAIDQLIGHYCR